MGFGSRLFPIPQVAFVMMHWGKSAKLVFIFLSGIVVMVWAEKFTAIESKQMPQNSAVALDAIKAKQDANKEINAHFNVCPADIAEKVRSQSISLPDVDISAEECGNDSEVCYKNCLDGRNGSACLALAQLFEARKPTEDPIQAQMLYAQACATGNSSGCTNRGSGIRNGQYDGDPMLKLAPQVLASCYYRTFQFSCGKGDAWGCAMLGQSYQVGEGVEPSESEARRYYLHTCEIDDDAPSCDFARKLMAEKATPSENNVQAEIKQLGDQATKLYGQDKYQEAISFAVKALAIAEQKFGQYHPKVAYNASTLANLYADQGNYDKAEPLYLRSLAITEKTLGKNHPALANSLYNLARLYKDQSNYTKAEPLYLRSLAISEKALGKNHPDVASSLSALANFYADQGSYAKAEQLYLRILAIEEKALDKNHPDVAYTLNNIGLLYGFQGNYAMAEQLFLSSLAIWEKSLDKENPRLASSLNNLAVLYSKQGNYAKAEPLYLRSLAIAEKTLGKNHPSVATSLNNLGILYYYEGNYAKAEPLYLRSLAILGKAFGKNHSHMATSLLNLAILYWADAHWPEAQDTFRRSLSIQERNAQQILALGDETRKKAYMSKLNYDGEISFAFAAEQVLKDAQALAMEVLLQRKGRVLEAMTDSIGTVRQHLTLADQNLLDQLAAVRSQQAALVFKPPSKVEPAVYKATLAKLDAQVEDLETQLSARSAEFRSQRQPVTVAGVQAALPKGSVLVDMVVYEPFNPKASKPDEQYGEPQYAAYVLHPSGAPKALVLGDAKVLDSLVSQWRHSLANPGDKSASRGVGTAPDSPLPGITNPAGQQLYAKIIKPLLPLIGDSKTLFIAPDGDLNLLPLGALPDETGHYLLESHEINYLTSGRDMLKWSIPSSKAHNAFVLANPDFDGTDKQTKQAELVATDDPNRRSVDYSRGGLHFGTLPGTAQEAEALGKLLPDGTVLTAAKATESALKGVHSPRILHLATHGFFLPDQPEAKPEEKAALLSLGEQSPFTRPQGENPLLRSGIALAGANHLQTGTEDGVLTALEAAGLDLWGTQLVVLSACETGIGKVSTGEGVYGLRRALVNAGAETQVMSLWKVDDNATRDLMVDYYKRLLAGTARDQALKQAQLAMINSKDRQHPYYWAAFIASGDVRPMAGAKQKSQ